jgi:hypothetical protein
LQLMGDEEGEHALPEVAGRSKEQLTGLLERCRETGLLTHLRETWYTIHPALPWFLRQLFAWYYLIPTRSVSEGQKRVAGGRALSSGRLVSSSEV